MGSSAHGEDRVRALAEGIADRLRSDPELVSAFERTPGKVVQQLGVEPRLVASVLEELSGGW
jgi:hypothetical protein